jgi:hypothetical protein
MKSSQEAKHLRSLEVADAGVVIGSGPGTLRLVLELVHAGKPVVTVVNTGGFTESVRPDSVPKLTLTESVERLAC